MFVLWALVTAAVALYEGDMSRANDASMGAVMFALYIWWVMREEAKG